MQSIQPINQYAYHVITNTFAELMTTAHWIISTYPALQSGINRIRVTSNEDATLQNDHCTDPNQEVTDFITSELKKIATKTNIAIKIHPTYSINYPIASLSNHILIAQYVADEITEALKNNDQKTLNKWRAVMQHEATHIKNNDLFWRSATDLTTPVITHALFHIIWHIVSNKAKINFSYTWLGEQYMKVTIAMYKLVTTHCIRMALYRYHEKQADNGIVNDIELLNGMKTFLNDFETITIKNYGNISPIQYKIVRWINNFYEEHPLPTDRIKRLDQRITLLEKQSQNNS
jgi:hypothetical protein